MRALGRIELIIGPMFSGKTSELLRRIRRHQHSNKKCVVVKHSTDVRACSNIIQTHDLFTSYIAVNLLQSHGIRLPNFTLFPIINYTMSMELTKGNSLKMYLLI